MKLFIFLLATLFLIVSEVREGSGTPAWYDPFSSSRQNAETAQRNYPNNGIQRWVARGLGDEIPNMRDDLIRRKNKGEGTIMRHLGAWSTWNNWARDSNNDRNEAQDPWNN